MLAPYISRMIEVVRTINAPLFGLDTMLKGAQALDAMRVKRQAEWATESAGGDWFMQGWPADESDIDAMEATIIAGARVAFACACCKYLPDNVDFYQNDQSGHDARTAAGRLSRKLAGQGAA